MTSPLSPSTPSLRIDTSNLEPDYLAKFAKLPSEGPSIRTRARALSQVALPSLRILSSPGSDKAPTSPLFPSMTSSYSAPTREKAEYQKLVELQFDQLRRRPRVPSFHESFFQPGSRSKDKYAALARPTKVIANINSLVSQEDSDDDDTVVNFSSETAAVRTKHLRDVLQTAMDRGWDVFELRESSRCSRTSYSDDAPSRLSASPFRRRRRSQSHGRSRTPSPALESGQGHSSTLFAQCLQLLHSLITEDCRFPISPPRPEYPPHALQAFCLDIAQLLAHAHRTYPSALSQIGFTVIPAFSTFHPQMLPRLLQFFEEVLLRRMFELSRAGPELRYRDDGKDISPSDSDRLLVPTLQLPPSIQVEEADEPMDIPLGGKSWHRWLRPPASCCISSSNTPGQAPVVYYSSSLVTPLLAAISERIDLESSPFMTLHRFYRFFDMIVELKPDSYLDVLQIVAYHTQSARCVGLSLLSTYWPRSLGHFAVSKSLATLTAPSLVSALQTTSNDSIPQSSHSHIDPYVHHFVPWRFRIPARPVAFDGASVNDCKSCYKPIDGFALFCPLCMSAVHFDCYDYPGGNLLAQYSLVSDPNKQKVAMHRFCHSVSSKQSSCAEAIRTSRHSFRPVELFALALCFVCRQPLWGCRQQGVKCDACDRFAHAHCVSSAPIASCGSTELDSSHMTISWTDLQTSFHYSFADLLSSAATLDAQGYEEISVALDVLWIQRAILQNGITLGSIVVEGYGTFHSNGIDEGVFSGFELDSLIAAHDAVLRAPSLQVSACLSEFLQENQLNHAQRSIMYDWSALTFIASTIKTPLDSVTSQGGDSSEFLAAQPIAVASGDTSSNPFEVLSLAHIRDALGICFNLHSEAAARHILGHLYHVGLYERLGSEHHSPDDFTNPHHIQCVFPLPLGLDMSVDVEVLVSAIEASLSDISLSINEAGFLLLARRFWPNQMATGYALRRLARAVVSWVIGEDDSLAVILREHVALNRAVPGVRAGNERQPWPYISSATAHSNSINSGGDYVAQRRALLHKYASVWLLALHDQDITFYALAVYDVIAELAEEHAVEEKVDPADVDLSIADTVLRSIIRINQAKVAFTAFDDILMRWLEANSDTWSSRKPILSLQRLFNRDGGVNARSSSARALTITFMDSSSMTAVNPWDIFIRSASADQLNLQRGLRWLRMFAISAVDIPTYVLEQLASLSARFKLDLQETSPLATASLFSTWLKSLGRQDLLSIIGGLHVRLSKEVLGTFSNGGITQNALYFIRVTLATCLLLAGCERDTLIRQGFILEEEVRILPSRRLLNSRAAPASSDPITLSSRFVVALGDYIEFGTEETNTVIAKFFHLFVTECPYLESYEVDNFILRNSAVLCASAWKFYDLQNAQLSTVRPSFLLRVLVVDSDPFEDLIQSALSPAHPWQRRLASLKRLFRVVIDVTNTAFTLDDRQWRSSVIFAFNAYFSAMWQDPQEEVRVAVNTWSHTLLPAHFEAIAQCWNEALTKAPIQDRVKIAAFLIQLHPHFRTWPTLSWDVIIGILMEEDCVQRHGENEDGPTTATYRLSSSRNSTLNNVAEDSDGMTLHALTVLLSLKLLSAGVNVDLYDLLKIKLHLLRIVGFQDVTSRPSASGQSFYITFEDLSATPDYAWPCIDQLLSVLDSPFSFSFSSAAMTDYPGQDEPVTLLIGSIFIDVLLAVVNQTPDLLTVPFLSAKGLLESLLVIIYKHDFDSKPLRHLAPELRRAVRRILTISLEDTSYELRHLTLSVVRAYVKHRPSHTSNFVGDAVDTVAQLLINLRFSQEDVLAVQALSFLETSISAYADKGLLPTLLKKRHDHAFYVVLRLATTTKRVSDNEFHAVRDALLRDTLLKLPDLDADSLRIVLDNLCTFIHEVHNEGLSPELMQSIGAFFNSVARRAADGSMNSFDPSPLLLITSTLIENNKTQSRDLMLQTETLLRTALVRFRLSSHSLMRVLQVTMDISRKNKKLSMFNFVSLAFLEILSDTLRGGSYTLSFTLCGMAEAVIQEIIEGPANNAEDALMWITRLANDGMVYLLSSNFTEGDADIHASLRVAQLIFYGAERKPEILHQQMSEQYHGKTSRLLSLGAWNILLLAALSYASTSAAVTLMRHFSVFTLTYRDSLTSPSGPTSQASNINHCYTSIKLWLLLERKISNAPEVKSQTDTNVGTFIIWNELWSPFLLLLSELTTYQTGMQTALASVASASVADVLLFLRDLHSVISLENVQQVSVIKAMRVVGHSEAMVTKLDRTMRDIHQPAPPVPWDVLLEQAKNDVTAAMKLERLELHTRPREPGRAVSDWQWRDSRVVG